MRTFRQERLSSLILRELNNIISRELEFDGALATLTDVELSKDFDFATIGVSVLPSEKTEAVVSVLKKFQARLQHLLSEKIKIRRTPQLIFRTDYGYELAAKVEKRLME